jgi:hypothetical protein
MLERRAIARFSLPFVLEDVLKVLLLVAKS